MMNWKSLFSLVVVVQACHTVALNCCPLVTEDTKYRLSRVKPYNDTISCYYVNRPSEAFCGYDQNGDLSHSDGEVCHNKTIESPFCYKTYPPRCCPELDLYPLEKYYGYEPENKISCSYKGLRLPCDYNSLNGAFLDGGFKCMSEAIYCPDRWSGTCENMCTTVEGLGSQLPFT